MHLGKFGIKTNKYFMNNKAHFCIHGASSLIGKNFCKYLLSNGYSFTVIARAESKLDFMENEKNISIYKYNKSISELVGKIPKIKDGVFIHLAWAGVFGTEKDIPSQITFNIPELIYSIELSNSIEIKHWIGFGSQAEYGNINSKNKIDENFPLNPITLYGKSKVICSNVARELCKTYNIEYSWLRLFSSYGPNGTHKWFIDYLIDEMKNNKVLNVTKCEQYLDYLHVDDISELLVLLSKTKGIGVANLGSGKAVQLKKILETIHTITNSKSVINYGALEYKSDQGMFNEADISKLSKMTGWKPKIGIEDGLSDMIKRNQ